MSSRQDRAHRAHRWLTIGLALSAFATLARTDSGATELAPECPPELIGTWTGTLAAGLLFDVELGVVRLADGGFEARVETTGRREKAISVWLDHGRLRWQSEQFPLEFSGRMVDDGAILEGFIHHAATLAHVRLERLPGVEPVTWAGSWSPLGRAPGDAPIDLRVADEGDGVAGFLFFRGQTMPGLWTHGLTCSGRTVRFFERNLGLSFEGTIDAEYGALELTARAIAGRAPIRLRRISDDPSFDVAAPALPRPTYRERTPPDRGDGWARATPSSVDVDPAGLARLVEAIASDALPRTHAVLIARRGHLVFEEYFAGFDADTWHDTRSASKTIASALIGIAIDAELIDGVDVPVLELFPGYRRYDRWDRRKARITVRDLLTMSSGLDGDDYDPKAGAAERSYQSQRAEPDWVKFVLDQKMVAQPGELTAYSSANALLLGGVLREVASPVEWFAHERLFGPLGARGYKFFLDPLAVPYMGGGMYLRPRDLAKLGQLYLNGGVWGGRRILSEAWVRESTGRHAHLTNVRDRNEYGYLWWHASYAHANTTVASIEARGAGGQYVFVIPELDTVAVVTSGNYRNGRFRQPEEIMERYILPAVLD